MKEVKEAVAVQVLVPELTLVTLFSRPFSFVPVFRFDNLRSLSFYSFPH